MNFKLRRYIVVFSFLLLSTFSYAQNVFIATDFVACGTGLKDSSGKWIVQPIYQEISRWPMGNFKVLYGSKEGVIDSNGTIVVPIIYDRVRYYEYYDASPHILFTVTNDGKTGLVNSKNQFIVPVTCRQIDVGTDGLIIAEKTWKRYSIYTIDGRETIIPGKQGTEPYLMGEHLFGVSRNSFGVTFVLRYFPKSKKYSRRYRYRITLRKKFGVMNDSLRIIVPKKFSSIQYSGGEHKLIAVQKRKKTGYYSTSGKEVWKPVFEIDHGYRSGRSLFGGNLPIMNAEGVTAARYNKKYGIISANGDTVLPFIYSSIQMPYYSADATSWAVEINGKSGIYNPQDRKWVLEPVYERLFAIANFEFANDTTEEGLFDYYQRSTTARGLKLLIAKKDGKYGLITSAGQEILPFIYDAYNNGYGGYCLKKDTSFFMIEVPQYTRNTPGTINLNATKIVQKAPADLKLKKVTTKSGAVIFINPDLVNDSAQLSLYQLKTKNYKTNTETHDHFVHAAAVVITPLYQTKNLPGIGKVYSYHTVNMNYPERDSTADFIIESAYWYWFHMYSLSISLSDDYHTYYSVSRGAGVYREDGLEILRPHSYEYFSPEGKINGLEYFSIDCGKNKNGLIDGNGKLLLDTTWGVVGSSNGKYIWVKKKYHAWGHNYEWNILDTTTNQLLLRRKHRSGSASPLGKTAVIIERPEGKKLYNMDTRSYILDGNVRNIFAVDSAGNYFAVRTCYGNIGIIDGNGKWLTDTIWKMLIDADNVKESRARTYRYYYSGDNEPGTRNYCVLSNDTGWVIFDAANGIVSKNLKTKQHLMTLASNAFKVDSISGELKFCADCPTYSYSDSTLANKELAPWQEALLFDSLFTASFIADTFHHWSNYGCQDCRKRNPNQYFQYGWSGNYDREVLHHKIEFKNESCISVARENKRTYSKIDPKDLFFTVMLFNDGPHNMLLDSLFTGEEWKSIIATETSLYFESHPNIQGNCHNPYMLPVMMKDRFVITPAGIVLYPPNYKEDDHQLFVLIGWEKLKPYLRKDVAKKLNLR